jgi:hypothetical protein
MKKRNNSYEATKAIYKLKRQYSQEVVVQKITETERDWKNGNRQRHIQHVFIRRAVVTGTDVLKRFVYDLSFIAANKNFIVGGLFDQLDNFIIIDGKDLPKGFKINHDSRLIIDSKKFEIKKIAKTPDDKSYFIHGRSLETYEFFEFVKEGINFRGEV